MVSMVFQDGENEGIAEAYAKNISIVMKKLEMSFDQTADLLEVPPDFRVVVHDRLLKERKAPVSD